MECIREIDDPWDLYAPDDVMPDCFLNYECGDLACAYCSHRSECLEESDKDE